MSFGFFQRQLGSLASVKNRNVARCPQALSRWAKSLFRLRLELFSTPLLASESIPDKFYETRS